MAFCDPTTPVFCEQRKLKSLANLIGRTPLLAVHLKWKGQHRVIFAKAEHYNLTGSTKDRMALNILRTAYANGDLGPNDTIAEATSGSAGIAIAALGRALGHPVRIYMPDWMSEERKALLTSLGVDLHLVSRDAGGFMGALAATEALKENRTDVFLPCQFANQENCNAHQMTTGPEILSQLASVNLRPDAFVAGVGTGGTIMGVGRAIKRSVPNARIHPLEPAESRILSTGRKTGSHRIQGIFDDFVPAIVDLDELDDVIAVSDGDAILMAQQLASQLGLAVGISSGANLIGALRVQDQLGPTATVVTMFCDDNKKYLSTDLAGEEPVKPGYISPHVDLVGFESLVCAPIDVAIPAAVAV